jgi:hypothetical protein
MTNLTGIAKFPIQPFTGVAGSFKSVFLLPESFTSLKSKFFGSALETKSVKEFPSTIHLKDFEPLFSPMQSHLSLFAFNMWNELVQTYSECALTRPSGKLVALSGLARLFQDMTGDEYLAGLWRSRLSEFLDWRVYKPARKLSSDYCAPSWSWASLDGPVRPSGISVRDAQLIVIKEVQVTYSTFDYTGQVFSGFITVEGLLVQATYHGTGKRGITCQLKTVVEDISATVWEDALGTNFEDGMDIHCLALKCNPTYSGKSRRVFCLVGLLLEPLPGSSHDYARIGHFVILDSDDIEKFGISVNEEEGSVAQVKPDQLSIIKIL